MEFLLVQLDYLLELQFELGEVLDYLGECVHDLLVEDLGGLLGDRQDLLEEF